ncbi:hypothetical protein FNAPI_6226, partial [Fusarium napiforme]
MYYCTSGPGNPTSEHKAACPWCFLRRPRYPVPLWQTSPIPRPTKEQLDRLLHRTSDGLGFYRWIFVLIFVFLLAWLLWTIGTICLDWYDASRGMIPFVDLMDEIAENAGLAFSVLQLPLYTFVPHQISGGLDPFNGLQPSQFAIFETRGHIRTALAVCQEMSERDGTADEEMHNITEAWEDAHNINWLYFATLPDIATAEGRESRPQAALRLTKTYITLLEEAFTTVGDRHRNGVKIAALSKDSLYLLYTVIPTLMNQLHETMEDSRRRKHALMEATSQIIEPLKACQAYFERNGQHSSKYARETERLIHHANHIADLYKLSASKLEQAESAARTLSRELKRKYFLRLEGDVSEVAGGLSRVCSKVRNM